MTKKHLIQPVKFHNLQIVTVINEHIVHTALTQNTRH
uniref:Uncharacterized protein n=1 Tax=Anguilla anguilla TaxID=7936 RepID=A0A0E9S4H8_ANGAN